MNATFFRRDLGPRTATQQQSEAITSVVPTLSYIIDTFPILKRKGEAKHGHYRPEDAILEIYDLRCDAIGVNRTFRSFLDPQSAGPARLT